MKRVGMLLFVGCLFFLSVITANADRKVGSLLLSKDKSSKRVVFVKNNPEKEFRLAAAKMTAKQRIKLKRAMRRSVKIGDALTVADNFLEKNKRYLGINEVGTELFPKEPVKDQLGMTHVYYEQRHNGIKVFGSHASVHLRKDGAVSSAGLNYASPLNIEMTPKISEEDAKEIAKEAFTKDLNIFGKANAYASSLVIMHEGLFRNTRSKTARLAWEVKVKEASAFQSFPVDENYYISAKTGNVIRHISNVRTDVPLFRRVFDCTPKALGVTYCASLGSTLPNSDYPTYRWGRTEGAPVRGPNPHYGLTDTDDAYEILGGLDAYYWEKFGLDGADGAGGMEILNYNNVPTKSTTCQTYNNAYWIYCPNAAFGSNTMGFCKGTVWPDIVGHEYQHGVLHWRPAGDMTYYGEPGALEESSSDIMGTTFEHYYDGITDWIGAGYQTVGLHPRNFADPPSTISYEGVRFPDKYHSPLFICSSLDSQGVHINSMVISKAFYLFSQGGNFNGCTVQASGINVAEQIMYRVVRYYYGANESFNGAYNKIQQACTDLYPASTCDRVKAALQAVEIDQQSPCSGGVERAPYCADQCPSDPLKTLPGVCGCGVADTDSDNDGTANCNDLCPSDPVKTAAGVCGCGVADTDSDSDSVPDCNDACPADAAKTATGQCGCGSPDTDSDSDGTADCNDLCPNDPGKTQAGVCGCGISDADSDNDGTPNCYDLCPTDPGKIQAGVCGCGVADTDSDGDLTLNCNDACPSDPNKTKPLDCGCGVAEGSCGCADTDGGINSSAKGTVVKNGIFYTDSCLDSLIIEYSCSNGNLKTSTLKCPSSCSNGSCVGEVGLPYNDSNLDR